MINNFYKKMDANPNFPEIEKEVLKFWNENNIFEASVESRPSTKDNKNNEFIFYDGPPFANGLPHYGHLLTGFIKDVYARYQTTKGKKVERRFGWDCHGLPAEMGSEKELKISGRGAIIEYGIDKFNNHCKTSVMKYTKEWEAYVNRQARWVDFENDYKTMDIGFMESVIWAFKELHKKGLIYESMRVMPYSWACETPLSNFETRLDNSYRERADKTVVVAFELVENFLNSNKKSRILAWTTTPWTLPSNLALAVSKDIQYVAIEKENSIDIVGKFAIEAYKKELSNDNDEIKILAEFTGEKLEGLTYKPLFGYFKDHPNSFKVLIGDFVLEGDGTGIVHMAPGFGEDDQILCQKHGIEIVCPVDSKGRFTNEVQDFVGLLVFDANDEIIKALKIKGNWVKTDQYLHNYPHCWRTDTPLIYKAMPSWYVEVTKFKDRMVELNQEINWIPSHIKDGLFGKWLAGAKDWSISRNRFFGTPIPVWKSDDPKYPRIDVYGSIAEMEKDFGVKINDLHRPFIDSLTRKNPDDPTGNSNMVRVEDVFDCWFESGSMPYAQVHYPFENKDWFETHFPADFIVEYVAQTRGWFYTLMVLSTALFDRPPFLNCICHGVILDATGQKLSKRLNNYADPMDLFELYGADALRMTMLSSTVTKGQELLIDKEGKMVAESLRLHIKPIWNAYHFFTLYINADKITPNEITNSSIELDRYILSKLKVSIDNIVKFLDAYDTQSAYLEISAFFEVLNNWFIRRSRSRFWDSSYSKDKQSAYDTLYTCLIRMMVVSSSLIPLISEAIFKGLVEDPKKSVHLEIIKSTDDLVYDTELINKMDIVRDVCTTALFVRNEKNIRIRQPLSKLEVFLKPEDNLDSFVNLIMEEVNVKEVKLSYDLYKHADKSLNLNFKELGKRLPNKVKDIIAKAKSLEYSIDGNKVTIADEVLLESEYTLKLVPKNNVSANALSLIEGMIVLNLEITKELHNEGVARDVIRGIQQLRKELNLNISDKIKINIISEGETKDIIDSYKDYIEGATLSQFEIIESDDVYEIEINNKNLKVVVETISA